MSLIPELICFSSIKSCLTLQQATKLELHDCASTYSCSEEALVSSVILNSFYSVRFCDVSISASHMMMN